MNKKLLLFLLMIYATTGWSQINYQKDYSISVNGHRITTTSNFNEQVKGLKLSVNKNENKYSLLQFTKIPTLEEQKELKSKGITLISYLNNNAYYVSIDSKFYSQSQVSKNIRTSITIDPSFKIDPVIANEEIPDFAKEGNAVKLVVSYFKGVDSKNISEDLIRLGIKKFKNIESYYQVYLQVTNEKLNEIAKLNWVQNIELIDAPVVSDNLPGVTSHKVNLLTSNISGLGYGLTGKGVKIGIWDGNIEKHIDHTGRVINREYETPDSHGSHVSGTIGGAGILDPRAKGMAPEVQIYGWNFNTQSNGLPVFMERDLAALNDGVELTSNSYGVNLISGYNTVRYAVGDRGDDDVTVKYPFLLNVYSNGNAQTAYAGGFNTSTKASKNALHVAANDPNDLISSYSSFGPTLDGRLVPQISAVGSTVYSLNYNNGYQLMSGTSMATPGVSGTLVLLYERYKNIYANKPLASLMKALVSNTAKDVGNSGPDYKYGFGNLNALRAIKVLDNKMFYTASIANGASYEKEIVVPAGLISLKIMLAYSDIGATPGATSIQVNDLDIKIVKDGATTLPWILDPKLPNINAKRGVDNLNNIEQITLDKPAAGTYKIIVTGTSIPLNTQEFSVVYDYVSPELVLTYPIGGEKFNPGTTEYIRWDYEGEDKTFNIEYSSDGGNTYSAIATNVPSAARNFAWIVPAGFVPNAKIRISAGSKVDVSTQAFSIMSEPKNLVIVAPGCGGTSYKMDWDAIAGAKYEVLKLNGSKFDLVATTNDPTYTFTNLSVGSDNWFAVRAIDIASGLVSERSKAINVEPIDKPIFTALNLPYKENFNDRKPTNYTLSKASLTGTVGYQSIGLVSLDAVKMSGSNVAGSPLWVASTTANAFTNNPNYIKRLSFCEIDATSLTGKAVRMKFDLVLKNDVTTNKNFFRVLVNGVPLTSSEDAAVYAGTTTSTTRTLTYNLAAFAGTKFNVVFEGVMDNDANATTPVYNTIFVDNVEFFEATATDLALTALTPNVGLTANETVTVKVYNFSPVAVSNVPVSYKINQGATVNEIIAGPINPLSEVTYNFTQKANYSVGGVYTVVGQIMPTDDSDSSNNSLTRTVTNSGTDVLMGTTSLTTCSAAFTDSGSRYANYANNLTQTITFTPATVGASIKVDFTEFSLETGYDYLFIYNGPLITSPLLGVFDGSNLPPSFTSTAASGQLTFRFTSDTEVVDKGWVANISCVAKPTVTDYEIVSIVTPEVLGKKISLNDVTIRVTNLGPTAATNVPVFYQIDGKSKVTDLVPTIASLATVSFTFITKADLSVIDATYSVTAGIDVVDNNVANNTLVKVVYNKNDLPLNTNTNGFAISRLKWDGLVNNSGTSAYSDFKSIKIPVYAGFTYQPEIVITKPERPITRDVTTNPGVFTMVVIDLNGDGNLTDEFYAGTFWVNTLNTATAPAIASTTSVHNFRHNTTLVGGLTIPAGTTSGEKLMRVIHMFRSPNESFNVNLGPTFDGLTTSRGDFEIEEYTINVLPYTAANAGIESVSAPMKPGKLPVTVSAVIRNLSNVAISNFPVAYRINGGLEVVQNQVISIAAGATATITFTTKADLGPVGDYTVQVFTKLVGDTDVTNDSKSINLSHVANASTNVTGAFDGIDDYIVTDSTPALNLTNNYSFEAWVNRKSPTIFGRILDKSRVLLFVHTNNSLALYKENSLVLSITTAAGSYAINTGLNSVQINKWHHVAFTVSATNVYTIYIDGVSVPFTATGTAAAATANGTLPAFIGNNAGLARGFSGHIDEVRIWSGVRDQATIAANTMTKYVGNEVGLLAYYSFAEGNKQFVFDTTTNDNTAIVTNADTNGQGAGKFWNAPVLLQNLQLVDQLSSSYDAANKTYTFLLKDGVNVATAIPQFIIGMNSVAKINGATQVSGVTTNNFSNPVTFTVEGVGFNTGVSESYTIKVLSGLSNESKLLSYNFKMSSNPGLIQDINTVIVGDNATVTVPYGIDVRNFIADFSVSSGAELSIDNVSQLSSKTSNLDYSNSVMVTVVSENKLSKTNYMVTVNAKNTEAEFLSYSVQNQVGIASIDANTRIIKVLVNNNANFSALVPSFQVSDLAKTRIGTYLQNSGVTTLNYTSKVGYNIVAQNGNINNWEVTIEFVKPVITLLGSSVVSVPQGCAYTESAYTAFDNLNKNITSSVLVSGSVNVNVIGQYIITYSVKDDLNNESFVTRTVNVVVNQKPVIIAAANINANSAATFCGATVVVVNATATDDCSVGVPTGVRSDGLALNANYPIGTTSIRWNVSDNVGNAATKVIQTVTVIDNVLPTVITKNITIQLNAAGTASIVVADINNGSTDNCGITTLTLDKTSFTCANAGANTVTLRVTDTNGNVATKTAIVTVEDKIAPVTLTKNITVQLGASANVLITAADVNNGSTDNCGIKLLELDKALFSCGNVGDNIVTLKVTDNSGNVSTKTAIVTVVNTRPNIIRKHFDNVIFFDNSSNEFVAYSWFKNGVLVQGQTAQYFKDSAVLNGSYYAIATKVDGTVVSTCALTFSPSVEVEYLKIAPNPVRSNSVYQLITNVDSAKLQNARVTVFNTLGILINDKVVNDKTTDMIAPSTEGIYIVRMTLANGKYFTKNLLVKN
ncbi:S8 family serine peptidase [Flavobacterium sp. LS2P90]|uniref:S8 family serine peptidase n=1 Tax=Flavobacterium xylosi TaxID=3230415 RepID=A0ABW6HR28_9FLAO